MVSLPLGVVSTPELALPVRQVRGAAGEVHREFVQVHPQNTTVDRHANLHVCVVCVDGVCGWCVVGGKCVCRWVVCACVCGRTILT